MDHLVDYESEWKLVQQEHAAEILRYQNEKAATVTDQKANLESIKAKLESANEEIKVNVCV